MNKSQTVRQVGKLALLLIGGIVVGYLLLVLVYLLPTDAMEENVVLSTVTFNGEWGSAEESYDQLLKSYQTTQLDNSTDAIMLLTAIHSSDESVFSRAANAYSGTYNAFFTIRDGTVEQGLDTDGSHPYPRYWHGYLLFLKPLLMVMTYMDIRMMNALVQGCLLVMICLGMQRRGLIRYVPAFLLSLVCVTPFVVPFSLQFSSVFYIFTIAMVILLERPKWIKRLGETGFFLLIGMATSYFDFLTYPVITFGMPYGLCLLLTPEEEDRQLIKRFLLAGITWGIGYVGMWAGKWVLGAIFSGDPYWWANIVAIIDKRSAMTSSDETFTFVDVCIKVITPFMKKPYLLVGVLSVATFGWMRFSVGKQRKPMASQRMMVYVGLACVPLVWYFFTGNHTYNHAFFTSRALAVSVFGVGCLATRFCEKRPIVIKK